MIKQLNESISFKKENDVTTIIISPAIPDWQKTAMVIWIAIWTLCGAYVFAQLFTDIDRATKLSFFTYLVFWGYFEYRVGYNLIWKVWGKELIRIIDDKLQIKRDIKGYGRLEEVYLSNISDLKVERVSDKSFSKVMSNSFWSLGLPSITLKNLGKATGFAYQVDYEVADKLFKLIEKDLRKKV